MNPAALIGVVGGFFGIVAVLGGAVAVLRANLAQSTIKALKENQEALTSRVTVLESQLKDANAAIERLEETKQVLAEQVKSVPAFASMADTMAQNFASISDRLVQIAESQERCLEHIARLIPDG